MKKNKKTNQIIFYKYFNSLIYFSLFIICFFYLKKMAEPSLGARWIFVNLMAVILPLIILIKLFFSNAKITIRISSFHIIIVCFFLWFSFSYFWTINKANFVNEFINHASVVLLILFFSFYASKLNLQILFKLFSIVVTLVSLVGILQYYGWDGNIYGQHAAPASSFVNKNLATSFVALLFPATYLQVLFTKSKKLAWIFALCFGITLSYLVSAATRSAWAGSVVSIIFIFCSTLIFRNIRKNFSEKIIKTRFILILLGLIFAFLIIHARILITDKPEMSRSLSSQVSSIFKSLDGSVGVKGSRSSIRTRLDRWKNGLEMIKDKTFFGFGLGSFDAAYPLYHKAAIDDRSYDARPFSAGLHNEPLQYLIEFGSIGFIFLLIFLFIIYFYLFKLLNKSKTEHLCFYLILTASITALLIDSLFNYSLHFPTSIFFLSIIIGTVHSQYRKEFPSRVFKIHPKKFIPIVMIIFLMLSIISIHTGKRKYRSNVAYKIALAYDKTKRVDKAAYFAKVSLDQWQYKSEALFHCSRILAHNFLQRRTKKNLSLAVEYNKKALENMPNNYLQNYIRFKLAISSHDLKELKNLEKEIPLLLTVVPYDKIWDAYGVLRQYYDVLGDKENSLKYECMANRHCGDAYFEYKKYDKSLKYYRKLVEKCTLLDEERERLKFLEKLLNEEKQQ
ncbi:MAG: O-antigen ligase family protein [Candidatus Cloacimonetes bacterium]|nr:O-antigen ligase family protein [Candidatus Cloacimonadota bacterium]